MKTFWKYGISAFLLSVVFTVIHGNALGAITLDDLNSIQGAGEIQLSPNGRLLAYDTDAGDIFIIPADLGSVPRKIAHGVMPTWSPNGEQIAYYALSGESRKRQLWLFNIKTGTTRQLTNFLGGIAPDLRLYSGYTSGMYRLSWSPDSTKLIFGSRAGAGDYVNDRNDFVTYGLKQLQEARANADTPPLVFTDTTQFGGVLSGLLPGWIPSPSDKLATINQLFIVDTKTLSLKQLTHGEMGFANPDWSPDGRRIACISPEGRPEGTFGSKITNIYVIDLAAGTQIPLTRSPGRKFMPQWSPDGRKIAYITERSDGYTGIASVISATGDEPVHVTTDDADVLGFVWLPDSRKLLVDYWQQDSSIKAISEVDVMTKHSELLSGSDEVVRDPTVSQNGAIAWLEDTPKTPLVIRFLPKGGSDSYVLYDFNPQIRAWVLGEQEVLRWKNAHGDDRIGILIKPVGYQRTKKYPVIIDLYVDESNGFKGSAYMGNQAWASMGYAVFFPNPRPPFLWSELPTEEERERLRGAKGWSTTVDDVMSGADELIQRGIADPDRMCLYGISNGGGITDYMVTQTHRFKCAVSYVAVWADWPLYAFLGDDFAVSYVTPDAGGKTIWQDPLNYIQGSPVYHLDKVRTPMLLGTGDLDTFGTLGSIEMYLGLRRFGQNVTLIRYPGQGHGFTGASQKDFWNRENAFFAHYLKPKQP